MAVDHRRLYERIEHSLRVNDGRYRRCHFNGMPRRDFERLREWFEAWHLELQRAYAAALNADDSVIGKQWVYHNTMQQVEFPKRIPACVVTATVTGRGDVTI